MKEKSKFDYEIDEFKKAFHDFREKKIVLYGTGRITATLVSKVKDFNIIGLCDRDLGLVGSSIYEKPVIDQKTAEVQGDILIINTAEIYWDTIYERIQDWNIPIYYRNGKRAVRKGKQAYSDNPYWNSNYKGLKEKLKNFDLISFDIFDTLLTRKVTSPIDVFRLVERRLINQFGEKIDFVSLRNQSAAMLDCPTIDEIYKKFQELSGWNKEKCLFAKKSEIEIDTSLIIGREEILTLINETVKEKTVYVISDMYYTKPILYKILRKTGVDISEENIIISCEVKREKMDGSLWKWYRENIVKQGIKAFHIGDDIRGDYEMPRHYGIESYYIMSPLTMLKNSSVKEIEPQIISLQSSIAVGMIIAGLFNSPFYLNHTRGKVYFQREADAGKFLFGNIIYNFLFWLIKMAGEDKAEQLVFFGRDGYLLEKAYQFIDSLIEKEIPEIKYLEISRRAIWGASFKEPGVLKDILQFPYNGNGQDFLKDRFGVEIDNPSLKEIEVSMIQQDSAKMQKIFSPYKEKIELCLNKERQNYLKYIERQNLKSQMAIVDLMVYGSTQYYLEKLLKKRINGYYFCVCRDSKNQYLSDGYRKSCFQKEDDIQGKDNSLWKNALFIEAFFTSPEGMVICIDDEGKPKYADKMSNQKYFDVRLKMMEGVFEFLREIIHIQKMTQGEDFLLDEMFAEKLFSCSMVDGFEPLESMKNSFFYDNGIVNHNEVPIWE